MGGTSVPPFLLPPGGSALVCGSANCLYDDCDCATPLYPGSTLIAVNGAPLRADHRFSAHWRSLKTKGWIQPGETVHSTMEQPNAPWVNYWWPKVNTVPGTSGWAAAKMAVAMGFDHIILCGIPMDSSPYTDGRPAKTFEDTETLRMYREAIESDTQYHSKIKSMSGWTKELLGG